MTSATAEHADLPADLPAGFAPHFRHSPLTDPWEPLYSRRSDQAIVLAVKLAQAHTNARGFAHGGLITALADNAMGLSCGMQFAEPRSLVTVNLSIDFLNVARIGQWLMFETSFTKVGGTLCFAQAFVTADGVACGRANATFRAMQ
ncbi:PaaI family thioesterase [Cupriavidus sp. YAF13]|uniref:PaaI family thioesterase n=1 Tax=Cupriavidus sp. YAF13 TaxID=3233075 RepID=UPI003F91BE54